MWPIDPGQRAAAARCLNLDVYTMRGNIHMSETPATDPFQIFQISKDLLSAEQKFLPSSKIFEQYAEVMRSVTQAQVAYGQALMRANAALLAALLERPLTPICAAKDDKTP
jgi:membrane-bound lytic murein transglycosylase B